MSNIISYGCKSCKTEIPKDTKGSLVYCKCKKLGIISSFDTMKIVGNKSLLFSNKQAEISVVYRFKKINSDKYYSGFNKLDITGKIYRRNPSLTWIRGFNSNEFIVEKFNLVKLP